MYDCVPFMTLPFTVFPFCWSCVFKVVSEQQQDDLDYRRKREDKTLVDSATIHTRRCRDTTRSRRETRRWGIVVVIIIQRMFGDARSLRACRLFPKNCCSPPLDSLFPLYLYKSIPPGDHCLSISFLLLFYRRRSLIISCFWRERCLFKS